MMPPEETKVEVVTCKSCEGYGKTKYRTYSEFNDVEIEAGQPCNDCRGTGRFRKRTVTTYFDLSYG